MQSRLMWLAVLQSATFHTATHLLSEHLLTGSFWSIVDRDPMYQEYLTELKKHNLSSTGIQHTDFSTRPRLDGSEAHSPVSFADATESAVLVQPTLEPTNSFAQHSKGSVLEERYEKGSTDESIKQPSKNWQIIILACLRTFFGQILLGPLMYLWHIQLERLFPSRRPAHHRNQSGITHRESKQTEADTIDADDAREEQVIQKWLQQGKIHRASLSWRNTFAKWVIQWTIGRYWIDNLEMIADAILKLKSPRKSILGPIKYIFYWTTQRMAIAPFSTIISFALIPASKRLPFLSGSTLIWNIFLYSLIYLLTPWAMTTEIYQTALRNITADLKKGRSSGGVHLIDEL
ncbi:hypothetical protein GGR58DRAFT_464320 [Xylaria digitata]|nr:hypothetical protein GGR58DRAFT_464320 [Xylaria digitata]